MKRQYRIQILIVFILLGGLAFLLFQPFYNDMINGTTMSLFVPVKIFGENTPDWLLNILPSEQQVIVVALFIVSETATMGIIFSYVLSGVLLLSALILAVSAITVLLRLIFNIPFKRGGRGLYLFLFILNLLFTGLCFMTDKVEFVTNMMDGMYFIPTIFCYIFTGGFLALYIATRIASRKKED